ncbi:MAG: hypothetical protein Kow0068_06180 [Marinilabiliales bacterium]
MQSSDATIKKKEINQKIRNMKKLFIFSTLITLLSSCSVMKTSTSKALDIYGAGVIQIPVVVDLEVSEKKVTGSSEGYSSNIESIKQDAIADALKSSNADVLVEPKFETETSGGITKATVTGFPATYKNFRSLKEEDIKLLEAGFTQKAVVYEPKKVIKTKNNSTIIVLSTFIGLGILAVLLL